MERLSASPSWPGSITSSTTRSRLLLSKQLVGAVSVFCDERAVAVALEVADDDVAHDGVVVDDEDGCHSAHCASVGHFA